MRKCIVCGNGIGEGETHCTACGFPAEERRFLSRAHCRVWMVETVEPYRRQYESRSNSHALREEVRELHGQTEMLQQALLKAFEQMEMLKKEVSDLRKKEDHLRTINRVLGSLYALALEDKQVLSRVVLEDGQKTYAVEDGIQVIGNNAFSFCSELSAVTIPDSVVRIGEGAFYGCSSLEKITLLEGLLGIGKEAFYDCSHLSRLTIPDSVRYLGEAAFRKCIRLEKIVIPQHVVRMEEDVFSDCERLIQVSLPDGLTRIAEGSFFRCKSLTEIHIPRGVTAVETWAFAWCLGLARVYLPETIRTIQEKAFSGVNATIFYPRQCFGSPWVGKNYGGNLTWVPM